MSAEHESALPVVYAPIALQELDVIWDWNEKTYGTGHAARYVDFLQKDIDTIGKDYARGRTVEARPELRYTRIRKRQRGHGHIAVYRVDDDAICILHIFHTSQNWQTTLAEEQPIR